ncbi:MAG: hypothetical protein PVJ21_01250 [Anaerolineales bacterium]|jgi:hypothetical protein
MSYFAFVVSVLMGIGSLVYAYAGIGWDNVVRGLLILGALWLFVGWKRWTWFSIIAILLTVALAGFGLWIELSPGWMIAGALGGLLAWDLSDFMRRLQFVHITDDKRGLERRHLTRVTIVALGGMLLATIAILVRVEFSLEWMMLLALVGTLGVTQLVAWLRRGG